MYKFRGKRIDNGEWIEGNLYETNENRFFITPKSTLWITESDGIEMRSVYAAYEELKNIWLVESGLS